MIPNKRACPYNCRSADALALLAIHLKEVRDYRPIKDPASRRWRAHAARGDFEILTTGHSGLERRERELAELRCKLDSAQAALRR
jgi:hypothetical protein